MAGPELRSLFGGRRWPLCPHVSFGPTIVTRIVRPGGVGGLDGRHLIGKAVSSIYLAVGRQWANYIYLGVDD